MTQELEEYLRSLRSGSNSMTAILLTLALVSHSLTLSPLSFTYHNFHDKDVENEYKNTVSRSTTWHPGLHLKYEHRYFQSAGWYFQDSFGGHAAGLTAGSKLDFARYFSLGVLAGVYARVHHDRTPMKFPLQQKIGPVDVSPVAFATGSVKVPLFKKVSLEVNAASAWKITNFGVGLNFRW